MIQSDSKYEGLINDAILLVIIFITTITSFLYFSIKIEYLEEKLDSITNESMNNYEDTLQNDLQLKECPLCHGNARLVTIDTSYYIECEECELRTNYMKSKKDIICYWNDRAK